MSGQSDAGPSRFCPSCYARNAWSARICRACGSSLESTDDFDSRLIWALGHPDTATAIRAAQAIASRRVRTAIPALREALGSPEAYRAAAAAAALASLRGYPEARAALRAARSHPSVLVRQAATGTDGADGDPDPR